MGRRRDVGHTMAGKLQRSETDLRPRRHPQQKRARQTVARILDAAARLLEEVGVGSFNTNLLAVRAGLRIRTIYRYFPNKLAVIAALTRRMTTEWDSWFDGFRCVADPRRELWRVWEGYLDTLLGGIARQHGGMAIRRAMRAVPDLRSIDLEDNEGLARQMAEALARRGMRLPRKRLIAVCLALYETLSTIVDLSLIEGRSDSRELLRELKRMHRSYLAGLSEVKSLPRPRRRRHGETPMVNVTRGNRALADHRT